jgi:hypothetical protein
MYVCIFFKKKKLIFFFLLLRILIESGFGFSGCCCWCLSMCAGMCHVIGPEIDELVGF